MSDPTEVAAEIRAGVFDGHLADVNKAITDRLVAQSAPLRWKIVHPAVSITEDDFTLGEAEVVERLTGLSWGVIDPWSSAAVCRAVLTVALQKRAGMDPVAAADLTAAATVNDAADWLQSYEAPPVPLVPADPGEG